MYRFQQKVSGIRVLNAQAVVSDAPGAPPALAADRTARGLERPPEPRIGRRQAIAIASDSAGVRQLRGRASASMAVDRLDGGTLIWRALIPSARPLADFDVLVDAATGEVLATRNVLQEFRTGEAKLFDPNPVVEHGSFHGLRDAARGDADTHLLTALRRRVELRKIKGGQNCLRGEWATAKVGRDAHSVCRRSLRWKRVTRSKDSFEALMTYYHITRAQQYIQDLGFSRATGNPIDDRSQVAVADAFGADNSFYSPITKRIKYGTGGVDDAEDADVILHEYGHAMQDSESHAFALSQSSQAGALAEGSSDYWAAAMSARSPGTSNEDDVCIFDWDATGGPLGRPYGRLFGNRYCGRRADDQRTFAKADQGVCGQDIHCVGQVWSSALWNLRKAIGGRKMDSIYLASQKMYTGNETFGNAAALLVNADAMLNGGAHKAAICAEMETNRGLAVSNCP